MSAFVGLAALVGLVTAAGCGSTTRPPPAEDYIAPAGGGAPVSGGFSADAGVALPGCGKKDDGSSCDCVDVPLFTDPPNLYFVLDRSGSMEEDGQWDLVRQNVVALTRGLGARARFGAAMFPAPNGGVCAPGQEVMKTRLGDPPSPTGVDGPTTKVLIAVTNVVPTGGTPTSPTLQALLPTVRALPGKTFVILATDGAPNCNPGATCSADRCLPNMAGDPRCVNIDCCSAPAGGPENCLDDTATIAAARTYAQAGIPLYVVGIPGSAPFASVLNGAAEAGGTALPGTTKYYRVDDKSQLLAALRRVAAKIVATCTFDLTEPPADPNAVNVYFDEKLVPKDPTNGWSLDGKRVTLLGTACDQVMAGDVLGVRIIAGCPTVGPR